MGVVIVAPAPRFNYSRQNGGLVFSKEGVNIIFVSRAD